jgi:glycosyltransferase involved in cell wall biosynthesis
MNIQSAKDPKADAGLFGAAGSPVSLPRVNVIVTCFNYERFVGEALDSVAAQSYRNFDCTVVDDASSDGSFDAVERWIGNRGDARFKLIRNERNLGQMGSIIVALRATEGEFVALLDADDIWFADFLMRHIEVHLNRFRTSGASCSDLVQIDAKGHTLAGTALPPFVLGDANPRDKGDPVSETDIPVLDSAPGSDQRARMPVRYVHADLGRWYWSVASGMVFRRQLVEVLIPDNAEPLRLGADFYLMALAHAFTGSFAIDIPLGAYRRHGENNFANLPVLGTGGLAPLEATATNVYNVYRTMMEHLLNANARISKVFSPALVRLRVRALFRVLLQMGFAFDDPRLAGIVGQGRLKRDRMRAKIGFLRRRLI